jgi:hypothetical protein
MDRRLLERNEMIDANLNQCLPGRKLINSFANIVKMFYQIFVKIIPRFVHRVKASNLKVFPPWMRRVTKWSIRFRCRQSQMSCDLREESRRKKKKEEGQHTNSAGPSAHGLF